MLNQRSVNMRNPLLPHVSKVRMWGLRVSLQLSKTGNSPNKHPGFMQWLARCENCSLSLSFCICHSTLSVAFCVYKHVQYTIYAFEEGLSETMCIWTIRGSFLNMVDACQHKSLNLCLKGSFRLLHTAARGWCWLIKPKQGHDND